MKWYLEVLKKYAVFHGRASRKEYWMFVLFYVIFGVIAIILDNLFGITISILPYGWIYILYSLALLIPALAVDVRRLHDTGRSGWMILIALIPIVGGIWLLVLMILDSQEGENKYGPNPKNVVAGSETLDGHLTA